GRLSIREDRANSILVDEVVELVKGKRFRLGLNFTEATLPLRHRITEILRANPGSTEVVFADSTTGKKYIAPKELFVNRNPRLMAQLTALLGEKNIALVQKKD
ncbi:MAG: hypothetical protein PUK13_04340, partial [Clostridiales bacterium]|nr:hypothetical protein [Clostridiales bacterium]